MNNEKKYILLDAIGNPIMRNGDEANPYLFNTLRDAFSYAEKEITNQDAIAVVAINIIERFGSGK